MAIVSGRQVVGLLSLLGMACAGAAGKQVDGRDDAVVLGTGRARVISDGSPAARGVLAVANTVSGEVLVAAPPLGVGLTAAAADNIIAFRLGDDEVAGTSDDGVFDTLAELDAVPFIGPVALDQLLAYAQAHGYIAGQCGNGVVDASDGETCDTAIASGPGTCPVACDDGAACTTDVLSNPGTCAAACVSSPIERAIDGDGCCPPGATANDDTDCAPVCGNGIVEPGEGCDDGNTIDDDACTNACTRPPTAFRFSALALRDPHVFTSVLVCLDATTAANPVLQASLTATSSTAPGHLAFSPTLVFRPLAQGDGATTALDYYQADCTSPAAGTVCHPGADPATHLVATSQATGTCLAPIPGTVHGYSPAVATATGPCFASSRSDTVTIEFAGVPLTLTHARVAAGYTGSPATAVSGFLMGFLRETDANATVLPATVPLLGGKALGTLLPGGRGSCAAFSDKDVDDGVPGWWLYLDFTATPVPWSGT